MSINAMENGEIIKQGMLNIEMDRVLFVALLYIFVSAKFSFCGRRYLDTKDLAGECAYRRHPFFLSLGM